MGFIKKLLAFKRNNSLVKLTSKQDAYEGWQDLIFTITAKEKLSNGFWSLTCKARHKRQIVGLQINILDGMPAGIVDQEMVSTSFVANAVEILSIGEESDLLIKVLSKLYDQPIKSKFTGKTPTFTAISLNSETAVLENGRFHLKLFFDQDNDQNLYTEFYLNPDLQNSTMELNEKDEDYRENIIKLFSED